MYTRKTIEIFCLQQNLSCSVALSFTVLRKYMFLLTISAKLKDKIFSNISKKQRNSEEIQTTRAKLFRNQPIVKERENFKKSFKLRSPLLR